MGLDRETFERLTREFQSQITDQVIDELLNHVPVA